MTDDQMILGALIAAPLCMAAIGWAIGSGRGRGGFGFVSGLLLGPIGWLIVVALPRSGRTCSQCLGVCPSGAIRCQHCGSVLGSI